MEFIMDKDVAIDVVEGAVCIVYGGEKFLLTEELCRDHNAIMKFAEEVIFEGEENFMRYLERKGLVKDKFAEILIQDIKSMEHSAANQEIANKILAHDMLSQGETQSQGPHIGSESHAIHMESASELSASEATDHIHHDHV
ncbi:hypothetical protein midi_00158 [Candidatus Midichloria mitochondrii IricVA]|uniref:Uncharacterized protein n=2 Tax=Candidatus Midichloria mitochondrii TaxID=234827 RepID=F7XUX9_MIDMI|nr:hypothetical protein midi_00158 [Candidatus Midichloria mitochondrii IricVA]